MVLESGAQIDTDKGSSIIANTSGGSSLSYNCGGLTGITSGFGLCANDSGGSTTGAGVYSRSNSRGTALNSYNGSGVYGINDGTACF